MALYNPYRNYDQGMDDAYMGREPQMSCSQEYMEGYEYAECLLSSEPKAEECDARNDASSTEAGKIKNNEQ